MIKSIVLIATLLFTLSAFYIQVENDQSNEVKAIDWKFTTCGDGKWTIQSLTLGSIPARNTNDDIDVTGVADSGTSFTSVEIDVKLNGVPLHSQTVKYEKTYQEGDTVEFRYNNFIPSFAPSGTYGLTFQFLSDKTKNGCIYFTFKL